MKKFDKPDYRNILNAATKVKPERLPFYEHIIDVSIMEKILGYKFQDLYDGDKKERRQYFRSFIGFFKKMHYDTVSFECTITSILPGSGSLYSHKDPVIKNRDDFFSYPWEELPKIFFNKFAEDFKLLEEQMAPGMKPIGGPGNGIFESVQDIVGLSNLSLLSIDDPELYRDIFFKMGEVHYNIWKIFLEKYSHDFIICRFGDDLGFKTSTMLKPDDIREFIIPQYKKIVSLIHSYKKPFIFHSCGNIFGVMEDLINTVNIDVKHSNEDIIAPFTEWQKRFGDRIAFFGGVDMSFVCNAKEDEIRHYVNDLLKEATRFPGFAFGTGNSIPDYMPVENYMTMIETARSFRDV